MFLFLSFWSPLKALIRLYTCSWLLILSCLLYRCDIQIQEEPTKLLFNKDSKLFTIIRVFTILSSIPNLLFNVCPIFTTDSWGLVSQSHIEILSPYIRNMNTMINYCLNCTHTLFLTFTTAPLTNTLSPSNDSPIRQSICNLIIITTLIILGLFHHHWPLLTRNCLNTTLAVSCPNWSAIFHLSYF